MRLTEKEWLEKIRNKEIEGVYFSALKMHMTEEFRRWLAHKDQGMLRAAIETTSNVCPALPLERHVNVAKQHFMRSIHPMGGYATETESGMPMLMRILEVGTYLIDWNSVVSEALKNHVKGE